MERYRVTLRIAVETEVAVDAADPKEAEKAARVELKRLLAAGDITLSHDFRVFPESLAEAEIMHVAG